MRLLVVEDEPDLGRILKRGLGDEGYAVDLADCGEDGLWRATTGTYDAVVLDVMLPDISGFDVLRGMRRKGVASPVLILTARDATGDRVRGLDLGADDYLVKPFAWEELVARLRALLRRETSGTDGLVRCEDLELDPVTRQVRSAGRLVPLTAREFELLHVLMRRPDRVFTRAEVAESVYDDELDADSNVLNVLFGRIRRKLADGGETRWIRAVRGVGYALRRDGP